jgi:hypothetical protein
MGIVICKGICVGRCIGISICISTCIGIWILKYMYRYTYIKGVDICLCMYNVMGSYGTTASASAEGSSTLPDCYICVNLGMAVFALIETRITVKVVCPWTAFVLAGGNAQVTPINSGFWFQACDQFQWSKKMWPILPRNQTCDQYLQGIKMLFTCRTCISWSLANTCMNCLPLQINVA